MTTNAISSTGYVGTYSLLRAKNEQEELYTQAAKADADAAKYTTAMGTEIRQYLSEVPKGDDNTLSFQDVDDYRASLEETWDTEVMADLEELGVDTSQALPLTYDPATGKVTVSSGHADKEVIDQYFEDNPDKVEEFHKIIQLGKLTSLSNTQISQENLMTNLQIESMAWWYEDNSDPANWFDGGGMLGISGSSSYTGLNITV